MKGVQCYELFGGIALKNHTCSCSRTNIHKKLFNKLIIIANTVPNNAIKDKFFCFAFNKRQSRGREGLIEKDSLYL